MVETTVGLRTHAFYFWELKPQNSFSLRQPVFPQHNESWKKGCTRILQRLSSATTGGVRTS